MQSTFISPVQQRHTMIGQLGSAIQCQLPSGQDTQSRRLVLCPAERGIEHGVGQVLSTQSLKQEAV